MFASINTYFEDRKKKKQLKKVLRLLYSHTKYNLNELLQALNPKDEFENFDYYFIIEIASGLREPYTSSDIDKIYDLQLEAYKYYVASDELRENIKKLVRLRTELSLLNFNAYMDTQRSAYEFNKYSPGGMLLMTFVSKGGPLTLGETNDVKKHYNDIKVARDNESALRKEAEDSFNSFNNQNNL